MNLVVSSAIGVPTALAFGISATDISLDLGEPFDPERLYIVLQDRENSVCTATPYLSPITYWADKGKLEIPRRMLRTDILCQDPDGTWQVIDVHRLASPDDRVITISKEGDSFTARPTL